MIAFQLLFVKVLSEAPQLSYGNQTKQRSEFSLLCSVFFSISTNVFGADLMKSKSLQMASKICFIPRQRLFFLVCFNKDNVINAATVLLSDSQFKSASGSNAAAILSQYLLTCFQKLPEEIRLCRFLRILDVQQNLLQSLPDVTNCVYLRVVLLSHNKLRTTPLRQLYCSPLEQSFPLPLTRRSRYHGSLQRLDVRHNKISSAPS